MRLGLVVLGVLNGLRSGSILRATVTPPHTAYVAPYLADTSLQRLPRPTFRIIHLLKLWRLPHPIGTHHRLDHRSRLQDIDLALVDGNFGPRVGNPLNLRNSLPPP